MSLANVGAAINQLQGFVASEFNKTAAGVADSTQVTNQGLAILPDLVREVATRADLPSNFSLKVAAPVMFDGTNDVDISTTAALLIAVVAQSNATETEDEAVLFYNTNTPTEGTTRYLAATFVSAGASAATARCAVTLYPEPVPFSTALTWSVVDNGSDGDIEGTSLGTANGVRVMVVYAN